MASIQEILASLAVGDDGWTVDAPEEWGQGRTLYGGMTAALSYAAIGRTYPNLPPLRSAQLAFVGPASGRLHWQPELLRRGRSSAMIAADCRSADGIATRSTFVFGSTRESSVIHDRTPRPDAPAPDRCGPLHKTSKTLPGFLGRFEFRLAGGSRLFEPGTPAELLVWVRMRDGDGTDPVAALLAFADALPCAAMTNFAKPAPVSTVTWGVDLHQPLGTQGEWRLVQSSSHAAVDGYSLQDMRVYSDTGIPLVSARQVVAIFA